MATIRAVVHIGERLRRLREERALRQEDLAKLAGIGKNTVNRIEKNRTEPHMTTIRKLADALKVEIPPSWLGRSESHLKSRNRAKKGTRKTITTPRVLPS
jgi:transcriptional regulator with XRE-family HTH domain